MSMFDFLQTADSFLPSAHLPFFGGEDGGGGGGSLEGQGGGAPAVLARTFEHYADGPTCNENDKNNEPPPEPAPPQPQVPCDPGGDASVCPTPMEPESEGGESMLPEILDLGHLGYEVGEMLLHLFTKSPLGLGPMPLVFPKMPGMTPEPEGA